MTEVEELEQFEHLRQTIIEAVANDYCDQEQAAHRVWVTLEQCKVDAERNVNLLLSAARAKDRAELHLCRTCYLQFAECKSSPTFASETDDRVVACDSYRQREKETHHKIWALITKYGPMSKLAVLYNTQAEAEALHQDSTTIVACVTWVDWAAARDSHIPMGG